LLSYKSSGAIFDLFLAIWFEIVFLVLFGIFIFYVFRCCISPVFILLFFVLRRFVPEFLLICVLDF